MKLLRNLEFIKGQLSKVNRQLGMTFIELVVVMSIFAIISGIALFNFGSFSDSIALQNLAQDIALEIKQAQSDAITGRNTGIFTGTCGAAPCRPAYGVYFETSNPNQFISFADVYNNGIFLSGNPIQDPTTTTITKGNVVSDLCAGDKITCQTASSLEISFVRPFPNAVIFSPIGPAVYAEITIESPKGLKRVISVNSLGQISVK